MTPPTNQKQLTLFVTFTIDPAKIETWKEAHRPVWAACAAEPECLLFDVFQDPASPGTMRLVEVWSEGREWFETVCSGEGGREREVLLMGFCVCTETIDEAVLCDAVGEVEADVGC
jgi:hypothetical protein